MEERVELKKVDAATVLRAMDQALPELEELCFQGDIKESIPEGITRAMHIMKEAIASKS